MKLKRTPDLHQFFTTYFQDSDQEADQETVRGFTKSAPPSRQEAVIAQLKTLLGDSELPIDEFGSEANRWFGEDEEARVWLRGLLEILEGGSQSAQAIVVKDSNGTPLAEGDSVQVIKDLKVKGGSSDLKRGTLIKKIHLFDDPDNIECRVDGSTLVLKTCFLKKA